MRHGQAQARRGVGSNSRCGAVQAAVEGSLRSFSFYLTQLPRRTSRVCKNTVTFLFPRPSQLSSLVSLMLFLLAPSSFDDSHQSGHGSQEGT